MDSILQKNNFFFIGVGGAGMSAIAQFLAGNGKTVKGSDRLFAFAENDYIKTQLQQENITCFMRVKPARARSSIRAKATASRVRSPDRAHHSLCTTKP